MILQRSSLGRISDDLEDRMTMRHCYLCDEAISGTAFRRSVGTGRSNRVSVGRRVSTSSTRRSGLRTLCSGCAGRVDADARLKNKVMGVGAILLVGFVMYANSGTNGSARRPDVVMNHTEPASYPAPADVRSTASPQAATQPSSPLMASAEAAVVPRPAVTQQDAAPVRLPAWTSAAALRWKHRTSEGTRWSLRQLRGNGMALLIDLGEDQVATVLVTPEFQKLDLPGMDRRVEFVRSEVVKVSASSAAYSFTRSGTVSPYP